MRSTGPDVPDQDSDPAGSTPQTRPPAADPERTVPDPDQAAPDPSPGATAGSPTASGDVPELPVLFDGTADEIDGFIEGRLRLNRGHTQHRCRGRHDLHTTGAIEHRTSSQADQHRHCQIEHHTIARTDHSSIGCIEQQPNQVHGFCSIECADLGTNSGD